MADEAVHIGPSPASQSYLVAEKIIEACKQTGAEAVHPGYGFLSERASFCAALETQGIVFIGPKPTAIEAMGDKIESKKFANAGGSSTVPGWLGVIEDAGHAEKIAGEIGYPVMIKASAGGGGKGMRIAWDAARCATASSGRARRRKARSATIASSSRSSSSIPATSRSRCWATRMATASISASANARSSAATRRSSRRRRRLSSTRRRARAMGEQAVALAKAVDYQSAGTVEFIVDKDRNFYFLEMNTRLQVEHPVTELVTGIDLVEQMIRIAAGEKLAIKQEDVKLDGWAVESRLYAEDPYRNFLPSIGRLTRYRPPAGGAIGEIIVRNDTGVDGGVGDLDVLRSDDRQALHLGADAR